MTETANGGLLERPIGRGEGEIRGQVVGYQLLVRIVAGKRRRRIGQNPQTRFDADWS